MSTARPWQERLVEKVSPEPNTGCWLWTAATDRYGYGVIGVGPHQIARAHRMMFLLHFGREPVGLLCHTCDTPACVSPYHVYEGNKSTNALDAVARGQMPRGSKAPWSKVTEANVVEIRRRHAAGERQAALAREFGLDQTTLHSIVHRVNWRHIV